MEVSIIVTNWNGCDLLRKNLPQVVKTGSLAKEIIIADDASTDDSIRFLKQFQKKHPKIRIIRNKKNIGFGRNSNKVIKSCTGQLVVLLNSDIYPHTGYIENTLSHFKNPKVFGVGFCEKGNENWGQIYWKSGYLQYRPGKNTGKTHITAWLSGGGSIVRRQDFLKLGGFDSVYEPFYCEDLDLGIRAWKSGYRLLWEPKAIVEHHHQSTMSKFPTRFLEYVKERNRLITVWRNITNPQLLYLNKIAIWSRVLLGPNYIKIICAAKKQIKRYPPPIFFPTLTDHQLISLFSK